MIEPLDQIDPIARQIATLMRGLMQEEVTKLAPKVAQATKADSEIMLACQVVAVASDKLQGRNPHGSGWSSHAIASPA